MSEEEMKKEENLEHEVIDRLKSLNSEDFNYNLLDTSYVDAMLKARNIILDLYNKEKEEKEKFKKALGKRITYCNEIEKDLFENCSNYVISKDKIKEKLEEYKNMLDNLNKKTDMDRIKAINERIIVLKEILGE